MAATKPITTAAVEQAELRARLAAAKAQETSARAQAKGAQLLEKAYATSYPATRRKRTRANPRPMGGSADAHLDGRTLETMRRDCQQLYRGNPTARACVQAVANMVVGDGPRVRPTGADDKLNTVKAKLWNAWAENRGSVEVDGRQVDVGRFDLRGMQSLGRASHSLVAELATDGDQLWVLTDQGSVQMIDAERIVGPSGHSGVLAVEPGVGGWVHGVKVDDQGAPVAYRVAPWSPNGMFVEFGKGEPVPADSCIFLRWVRTARNTQTRGEPGLQACVTRFEDLDRIDEAIRKSLYVAACVSAIFTTVNPQQAQLAMPGRSEPVNITQVDNKAEERHYEFEPGGVIFAPTGTDVKQFAPQHPAINHKEYVLHVLSTLSADLGAPIVLALLDPNGANFAGLRAILALSWRGFSAHREYLRTELYARLYRWKVAQWIREGILEYHDDWDAHDLVWPPMPVLNPKDEIGALQQAVAIGAKSMTEGVSELTGRDYQQVVKEIAFETRLRAASGVPEPQFVGTPGQPAGAGGDPASDAAPGPTRPDDPHA